MDLHNLVNQHFQNDAFTVEFFILEHPLLNGNSPLEMIVTGQSELLRLYIEESLYIEQQNKELGQEDDE